MTDPVFTPLCIALDSYTYLACTIPEKIRARFSSESVRARIPSPEQALDQVEQPGRAGRAASSFGSVPSAHSGS
jgi:hypothetical protein